MSKGGWDTYSDIKRVLIVIPAYNEGRFLQNLLFDIFCYVPREHVLVVDDGSPDETGEVASRLGVKVITLAKNSGKGAALMSAFRYAKAHCYDWVIALDADGQHQAKYIPRFLAEISRDQADIVIGNRLNRESCMPWLRRLSNGLTSVILSLQCKGARIHDSQCGFRAIRVSCINVDSYVSNGFQIESEIILRFSNDGFRFKEVPISTVYGDEKSSIRLFSDSWRFLWLLARYSLGLQKKRKHLSTIMRDNAHLK